MNSRRRSHTLFAAALLAVTGCSDLSDDPASEGWRVQSDQSAVESPADAPEPAEPAEPGQVNPIQAIERSNAEVQLPFIVHEWGTYTSVQTADGFNLQGLHHEEEELPPFVYNLAEEETGFLALNKGTLSLPGPVTQKLETPVIYFYGAPQKVKVDVHFPKGLVTEWYPQNETYSPYGADDVRDGFMSWDVTLSDEGSVIPVPEDDIWAPSREVPDAKFVTADGETDKFIFYRGMGRFETAFEVALSEDGEYTVSNESGQPVPDVFVLEIGEDTGNVYELGALDGFSDKRFAPPAEQAPVPIDQMIADAKTRVSDALVDTGLTRAEADAMVNTWERSYFTKPGHRILYVAPRAWTDELLPIEIEPRPTELVRTLVGRIDIVTHADVEAIKWRLSETKYRDDVSEFLADDDRFLEARVRATCRELPREATLHYWCHSVASELKRHLPSIYDYQR